MSKNNKSLDLPAVKSKLKAQFTALRRFSWVLFIGLVAILYGFLFLRINTLNNTQPPDDTVSNQVQSAQVPHIDKSVVRQLEALNDHSVNVQTLFNQDRSNPFQ